MNFSDARPREVERALAGPGLVLDLGAMRARVRSRLADLAAALHRVYPHFPFVADDSFVDVEVEVARERGLRALFKGGVQILTDGVESLSPQPRPLAFPQLEWGLNWCFARMRNQHLLLHSGVLEIAGKGLLLVAQPGSGKSTLTAALSLRGARVLSDEFGVVRLDDLHLLPIPKPIALKNQSIDVIRQWSDDAVIGPVFHKTHKGDVAHLAMSEASARSRAVTALPGVVVFPQWSEHAQTRLQMVRPAKAFSLLAVNSFNYDLLGPEGFDAVAALAARCQFFLLEYSRLDEAVALLDDLCAGLPPPLS